MNALRRYGWFGVAAAITAAYAVVSLTVPKSFALTAFSDIFGVLIMLVAGAAMLAHTRSNSKSIRAFWILMAFGFVLWVINQWGWAYYEIYLRRTIPDPYFADVVLFFHVVPMIAAVAWRPDHERRQARLRLSTLNFLVLLVWWIFLYAFIVFPHQYVVLNVAVYNHHYDLLYEIENMLLMAVLAYATWTSNGSWRKLYLNFLAAETLYTAGSQLLDRAVFEQTYYSGSFYDVPLVGGVLWMGAIAMTARKWDLAPKSSPPETQWRSFLPQAATLAILSLPFLGLWTFLYDDSPIPSRMFRLGAVLTAMLVLGAFAFMRQYAQDNAHIALLRKSREGYENQQRLQSHLVQKEKLASLGELVAGAAHEIDHPLNAIMEQTRQLSSGQPLTPEQDSMVRKIATQATRTRNLVSDLLSFAQQSSGEKLPVDLNSLLHRASQLREAQRTSGRIRLEMVVEPDLPRVLGNSNQLFQVIAELVENAMDALEEVGGGSLQIAGMRAGNEAVLQVSDSGPGIREPQRVFDPFYTTKPIGKGTGLGLSAAYGVIQDHGGQITCQNRPGGGAQFTIRLPIAVETTAHSAKATAS